MRALFIFRNYLSSFIWATSLWMFSLSSLTTKDMILAPVAKHRLLGKENSFIFIWSSLQIFLNSIDLYIAHVSTEVFSSFVVCCRPEAARSAK